MGGLSTLGSGATTVVHSFPGTATRIEGETAMSVGPGDRTRIHRAVSYDGTEIVGRVHGQGPPLVLVHGSFEDGDLDWAALLPFLRERFTCYLPSTRGRGLSEASADLSPERRVEDVTAFVESIGEPVRLVGESDGGVLALGAAARTGAVSAVAVHEPPVFEVLGESDGARFEDTVIRAGDAAADGDLVATARIFSELLANDDELAALAASDYLQECAHHMPLFLRELEQATRSRAPGPTAPSVLADIAVPVLLLHGGRSALGGFFTDGARHIAEHVADTRIREVAGVGHFGVTFAPEPIADAVAEFFETTPQAV